MSHLGICYAYGRGVDQNAQEAVSWFTHAAEEGDVGAQYNLGCFCEKGFGIQMNLTKAKEWYSQAAAQGHAHALAALQRLETL